jgi:hypothetical protein
MEVTARVSVWLAYAVGVAGLGYGLWHGFHDLLTQTKPAIDLRVYLTGARALIGGHDLYGVLSPNGLPFTYPPFAAAVFAPLTWLGQGRGVEVVWIVCNVTVLLRTCWVLTGAACLGGGFLAANRCARAALLFGTAMLMEPFLATVSYGQINLVLLWLVTEDRLVPRWRKLGGVGLGIATGIKLTPALFLPYLLLARRRADAVRMTVAFFGTVILGVLVAPSASLRYWRHLVFTSDRIGLPSYISNQSLRGALERTGIAHVVAVWAIAAIAVAVVGLLASARADRAGRRLHALALVSITMLLVSPISWTHHWVWILPLLALLLFGPSRDLAQSALLVGWLVATIGWVTWKVAPVAPPTPQLTAPAQFVGSAYTILGCLSLAWLVGRVWRTAAGDVTQAVPAAAAVRPDMAA